MVDWTDLDGRAPRTPRRECAIAATKTATNQEAQGGSRYPSTQAASATTPSAAAMHGLRLGVRVVHGRDASRAPKSVDLDTPRFDWRSHAP